MDYLLSSPMSLEGVHDYSYLGMNHEQLLGLSWLKHRYDHVVQKGFSELMSMDGRHRSGKSIYAVVDSWLGDDTFEANMENRLVSDYHDFFDVMENIEKNHIDGAMVNVEEAGVSMSSDDWYEIWMKTLTKMTQMFGYLHPRIKFVAPVKDFVHSRLRKMFHIYVKVDRFDNKESVLYPYDVKYNTIKQKMFYKKPRIRLGGQEIILRRIRFGKPPDSIMKRYAAFEQQMKPEMMREFIDEMKKVDVKDLKEEVDLDKLINYISKNYSLYESKTSKPNKIILNVNKITFGHRIGERQAHYVKDEAERKLREIYKMTQEAIEKKGEAPAADKPNPPLNEKN
jgi:hypothetical protein